MAYINGQQIVSGHLLLSQYRWEKLCSGTLTEPTPSILTDEYNDQKVALYGAAVKYRAPKRSDGKGYGLYLDLGNLEYNAYGTPIQFTVVARQMIAEGTSAVNDRYGMAVIDGSLGVYQLGWNVGSGAPPAYTNTTNARSGTFQYSFADVNSACNAVRLYSPRQANDEGMLEAGTEYEIWGLFKEVGKI